MFGNASSAQNYMNYNEDETMEEFEQKACIIDVSIPKVEPCYPSTSDLNEDTPSIDEVIAAPIPFTTPYKIKDPIVLLERCDKIWDTLKLIKDVQGNKRVNTFNALSSKITKSKSLYVKYQPVLGNDNAALPNFKFSVKTTKKLFCCSTCGKLYTKNRTLRHHSEKVHGIYIPPKRLRVSNRKFIGKEKESNNVETEKKSNLEISHLTNENKLLTDSLLQPVLSYVTECNTASTSNLQSQRRKKNILIRSSNNFDVSENIRKEREEGSLCKELKQNKEPSVLHHDLLLQQQCVLCKQFVKNIRKHLIDYHKIECSDIMLKELEKTSAPSKIKELEKESVNNEPLNNDEITQDKLSSHCQNKRKRESNVSHIGLRKQSKVNNDNTFQVQGSLKDSTRECDICFGHYKANSFFKHVRSHRLRGETKENFHLFNCHYWNSPLHLRQKVTVNSSNMPHENTNNYEHNNKDNSNLFKNKEIEKQMFQKQKRNKQRSPVKGKGKKEITCSCGRSFRNPYTLYIHKGKCNLPNNELEQPITNNKLNEPDLSGIQNNSDRGSGIGISITIKKKNNSYEVVGKDISNKNKLQESSHSKDAEASSDVSEDDDEVNSQDQQYEILESSKYSENHSILRIQFVDEDIDVDIEEDSQNNLCNNNISDTLTANEITDDFCKEHKPEIEVKQNMSCQTISNLKLSCEKVLAEEEHKNCNDTKRNTVNINNICVCGSMFNTKDALDIHINKHHRSSQLICGYCKKNFRTLSTWNKHQCSVKNGENYADPPFKISCLYCNTRLKSYIRFDEHIKLKHFDSVVPYQCFKCHKRFSNTASRRLHFDTDHSIPACSICGNKCSDSMKSKHEGYHYGLGFPCHLCKKTYSSKVMLTRHESKVHSKKGNNVTCDSSNSCFLSPKSLDVHVENSVLCDNSLRTLVKRFKILNQDYSA